MSSTTPPPTGGPEFLDQSGGEPLGPDSSGSGSGGGRRTAVVAGGVVLGLGLVGGAAWAAMSFFATGSQPAEALPGGTLGYASVDLDPSGSQKIEALEMIKKFPSLDKEIGGIDADADLLAKAFEQADCEGLDYADDVKPWLGYRFAVAAVDLGEDTPTPVGVLQVSDAGAAEDGLAQLAACNGEGDTIGWVVEGDWAIVAETEDLAQQVVDATGEGTLADDEDYQRWTGEVGDPGVMSMYAAPEAGEALAGLADEFSQGMMPGMPGAMGGGMDPLQSSEEMTKALEEFQGMAATVRFSDGALEVEAAAATGSSQTAALSTDRGDDVLATLPEDTAAALGFGLGEGWLATLVDQAVASSGGQMTAEDLEAQLQAMAGLTFDDVETAFGESAVIAVDSDIDPQAIFSSADGSSIPVGAKIQGDAAAIEDVFGKLSQSMGPEAGFLGTDAEGDHVAVGPNPDYRSSLLADGNLGDSAVYQDVIREGDRASAVFFVNFDANDWLAGLLEGQQEAQDNVAPLSGLGMSSWVDDDTSHAVVRLTTD